MVFYIFALRKNSSYTQAEVAHLVEHDLAKVGVAGSSPVFRSLIPFRKTVTGFFLAMTYC